MATQLDIVNDCLASLGETPLNTLTEQHAFKGAALSCLARRSTEIQAKGWWYNTETVYLIPDPINSFITLPGDCVRWQSGVRNKDTLYANQPKPWLVERGTRLYDTRNRTYVLTEDVTGTVIRELPIGDVPQVINTYIAAATVLQFQSDFDADSQKRAFLAQALKEAKMEVNSEQARQLKVNLVNSNYRLARIKRVSSYRS